MLVVFCVCAEDKRNMEDINMPRILSIINQVRLISQNHITLAPRTLLKTSMRTWWTKDGQGRRSKKVRT